MRMMCSEFGHGRMLSDAKTGGEVAGSKKFGRRIHCGTRLDDLRAAGAEATARGRVRGAGQVAAENDALAGALDIGVGDRYGGEQRAAVRMSCRVKDALPARRLDDAAKIHDGDLIADVTDDRQIVGDEDVGEAEFALQLLQEIDDLRLDREVERGDRLVADDQFGIDRQRPADGDTLRLSARKLVWEPFGEMRSDADEVEQLPDASPAAGAAVETVDIESLGDEVADRHARIEGSRRVLKDDLHAPAERSQLAFRQRRDVRSVEDDAAGGRADKLQNGVAGRGFPATGLANEAERAAPRQGKAQTIHGAYRRWGRAENRARRGEMHREAFDREKWRGEVHHLSSAWREVRSARQLAKCPPAKLRSSGRSR